MKTLSIAQSMVPSQRSSVQSMPNPREFSPSNWQFSPYDDPAGFDFRKGNALQSDFNFFSEREPWQMHKSSMFLQNQPGNPLYGHVNYKLNPKDQEQTNSHMTAYAGQKETRVADNISPAGAMRFPAYQYPSNSPPNLWVNVYQGSRRKI